MSPARRKYACSECTGAPFHGALRGRQRLTQHLAAEHESVPMSRLWPRNRFSSMRSSCSRSMSSATTGLGHGDDCGRPGVRPHVVAPFRSRAHLMRDLRATPHPGLQGRRKSPPRASSAARRVGGAFRALRVQRAASAPVRSRRSTAVPREHRPRIALARHLRRPGGRWTPPSPASRSTVAGDVAQVRKIRLQGRQQGEQGGDLRLRIGLGHHLPVVGGTRSVAPAVDQFDAHRARVEAARVVGRAAGGTQRCHPAVAFDVPVPARASSRCRRRSRARRTRAPSRGRAVRWSRITTRSMSSMRRSTSCST